MLYEVITFAYVIIRCWRNPQLAPPYEVAELSWRERILPFIKYVVPLSSIFIVVVGSIIGGIATPTESAALGAAGADGKARRLTLSERARQQKLPVITSYSIHYTKLYDFVTIYG